MLRERDAHVTTAAETNSDQTEAHTGRRYGTRHCYDHRLSLKQGYLGITSKVTLALAMVSK